MGPLCLCLVRGTSEPRGMLYCPLRGGERWGVLTRNKAFPSERVSRVVTAPLGLRKSKRQSHREGPSRARGRQLPSSCVAPCSLLHLLTPPFLCILYRGVGPVLRLRPQAAAGFDLWCKHSLSVQSWVISPRHNRFHIFTCKMGWFGLIGLL